MASASIVLDNEKTKGWWTASATKKSGQRCGTVIAKRAQGPMDLILNSSSNFGRF